MKKSINWRTDGVQVIPGSSLDANTAQTAGMDRKAAIDTAERELRNFGLEQFPSIPTLKLVRTTTANLRV
jgi:hypothetical protein